MKLIVNPHKIDLIKEEAVNEKEINISKCTFEFSDEFSDNLVKEAYFTLEGETYKQIIVNNECSYPPEVLVKTGTVELGVVAYEVQDEEYIERFNPSPVYFQTIIGSLKDHAENSQEITPSEMEQFEQALEDGLAEVANVDIDAEKIDNVATVSITNKYGETKAVDIYDGEKGDVGPTPNIQIGNTTTLDEGQSATVSRRGTDENPIFDFGIPKGDTGEKGDSATISVGTTTTLPAGSNATVTNVGTSYAGVFNFGIPKGEQGDDYVITQQDYNAIATVVETDIEPTLTNIETTANTANTTANTAKSIAEGANQALSYSNYQTMITAFNALASTTYRTGQNVYIVTREVPDLWVSSVESTSVTYTYTTDTAFITELSTNGYVQVGYYKLSALETQKVDLTNYITNTDYATSSTAGIVKVSSSYGTAMTDSTIRTVRATTSDIDSRANGYKVITPNNLDYAVRAVHPAVTTATASASQALDDFATYDMTISTDTTFTLPTVVDTTILHTIEIRATISNDAVVNLGTTHYIGDEPELGNGKWVIYYEYDGTNWSVGAIELTSGV